MKTEIATLPKLDLHCHLDGSLDPDFVFGIMERCGETSSPSELLTRLRVPAKCESLAEYLERFVLPIRAMQCPSDTVAAAYSFVHTLLLDNVIYAEVRFSPALLVSPQMTERQALESVLAGLAAAEKDFGVICRVIVCAMRHHSSAQNLASYRLAADYLGRGVCAVDLAGDEAAFPNRDFAELFTEAQRLALPYTIHAGECGSAENVRDAITLGASRIGHGIAMRGNLPLQQLCAMRRIGVEMCPTSNFQTKAVLLREDYPMREFVDNGILVTVNTDNRTVSNTSLTEELLLLANEFDFVPEELRQLMKNAVLVSFADDAMKDRLLCNIEKKRG